jgi:hypothetical protein
MHIWRIDLSVRAAHTFAKHTHPQHAIELLLTCPALFSVVFLTFVLASTWFLVATPSPSVPSSIPPSLPLHPPSVTASDCMQTVGWPQACACHARRQGRLCCSLLLCHPRQGGPPPPRWWRWHPGCRRSRGSQLSLTFVFTALCVWGCAIVHLCCLCFQLVVQHLFLRVDFEFLAYLFVCRCLTPVATPPLRLTSPPMSALSAPSCPRVPPPASTR